MFKTHLKLIISLTLTMLVVIGALFWYLCPSKDIPLVDINPTYLFDSRGQPKPAFSKLLEVTGIQHDGTPHQILNKTQQAWLRGEGQERWHMDATIVQDFEVILQALKELKTFDEIRPLTDSYDYAFILGATTNTMRQRLQTLHSLWESGIKFNTIIYLVGERPLDQTHESDTTFLVEGSKPLKVQELLPKTEREALQFILRHDPFSEEFRTVLKKGQFISASLRKQSDGSYRQPAAADIVEEWLRSNPSSGSILAISTQPYVYYQHMVLKSLLMDKFSIETVGPQAQPQLKRVRVYLDNVARWIYEEVNMRFN